MSKRIILVIISVCMLISIFSGCGGVSEGVEKGQNEVEGETSKEWTKPDTPVKIKYMTPDFASPTWNIASGNIPASLITVEERVKELFNIEFEYEVGTGEEYETLVTTRLAAGVDLPDVIHWHADRQRLIELYDQGLIISLDDLVNDHAPTIAKRYYELNPEGLPYNSNDEGNLLRIVEYATNIQNLIRVLGVRNDWLVKLGMDTPETVEEFYHMLKEFQEKDVNENGKKDEIMSQLGLWPMHRSLAHAFGVKNLSSADESWYVDDGNVYNTVLTQETKDYLMFVSKLVKEGLLDNEITSQTEEQFNEKLFNDRVGVIAGSNWMAMYSQLLDQKGKEAEYVQIKPLKRADGQAELYVWDYYGHKGHMITKDCKDPVTVMKWLEWCYTIEGTQSIYFGEYEDIGEYWEKCNVPGVYPAVMTLTDKGKEASKDSEFMAKIGFNGPMPKQLMGTIPDVAVDLSDTFGKYGKGGDFDYITEHLEACEAASLPTFKMLPPNEQQQKELDNYSDLFLYMDEMVEKFALGKEDFENWDQFVEKCVDLGMNEILNQIQKRYDDYKELEK